MANFELKVGDWNLDLPTNIYVGSGRAATGENVFILIYAPIVAGLRLWETKIIDEDTAILLRDILKITEERELYAKDAGRREAKEAIRKVLKED